jgi:hypothetical protein
VSLTPAVNRLIVESQRDVILVASNWGTTRVPHHDSKQVSYPRGSFAEFEMGPLMTHGWVMNGVTVGERYHNLDFSARK